MQRVVEVQAPGGGLERYELHGAKLLIGTGAQANVRLPPKSGLADSELGIAVGDLGVTVTQLTPAGVVTYGGVATHAVEVPWGDEVFVKGVRFTFLASAGKRKGLNAALLLAVPLAVLTLGFFAFQTLQAGEALAQEIAAPPLLPSATPCTDTARDQAARRAASAEQAAQAKQERFPFAPRDGVEAARLLSEACSCFEAAGLDSARARADEASRAWSAKMEQQYAALQLSLRVALDNGRKENALQAIDEIEALLGDIRDSQYGRWLQAVRRDLELKNQR